MAIKDIRTNVYVVSKSQMYLQLSRENKGLKRFYYKLQSYNYFISERLLEEQEFSFSEHLAISIVFPIAVLIATIIGKIRHNNSFKRWRVGVV